MPQNYLYGVSLNSKTILKFWFIYKFHLYVEISRKMWNRNFYGHHLVLCKLGVFSPGYFDGNIPILKEDILIPLWLCPGGGGGCTWDPGGPHTIILDHLAGWRPWYSRTWDHRALPPPCSPLVAGDWRGAWACRCGMVRVGRPHINGLKANEYGHDNSMVLCNYEYTNIPDLPTFIVVNCCQCLVDVQEHYQCAKYVIWWFQNMRFHWICSSIDIVI